jgi:hypothetical protein
MNLDHFYKLAPGLRAQVCIAVLLDGAEAHVFLENDGEYGAQLSALAEAFAAEAVELRVPLLGTLLREALAQQASK